MTIASYTNRTRVNSLEGYYATTTPTMLTSCDYTMRNSPLVSKTDWRSERKSAERKRCIKTIANGSQLHRTGIEPMSIAWKATMLPLHQRCSHQELWLNKEKQYSFVKNWLKIGEQSAERERSTKTFTTGWQLHRTRIEPMSIAWKATMRPLQQRCSHQELWLYNEKQSSCVKNWLTIGDKKNGREKTLHQNNRQRITIASYGNRTHVNSLEGYYATTTPTMLKRTLVKIQGVTVLFCQKLIDDRRAKCRERTQHQNIY